MSSLVLKFFEFFVPDLLPFENVMDLGAASGGQSAKELTAAVKPHERDRFHVLAGRPPEEQSARLLIMKILK